MESSIEKKGDYYCYCTSLLSLPESILDCILKRLSPKELITISQVCTNLRVRCRSDHLWENHIKKKWGKVFGDVAYKEWHWHVTKSKEEKGNTFYQMIINHNGGDENGSLGTFSGSWPMLCLGSYLIDSKNILSGQLLLSNSLMMMMALYISLENGKFWFPAQIYRGLLVSNALVSYDSKTNTFQARQQMGGWRIIGNNIRWDKVRAPPNETSQCNIPHQLSDSLHHLRPGDHIEIQWKASTEVPYDWWYAEIGHMDSCKENDYCCGCQHSGKKEMLVVEFKQYHVESGMRKAKLQRNKNGQQCENQCGIYGGIRKLQSEEEIHKWKQLFPPHHNQTPVPVYLPLNLRMHN
ncbi:F-box protein At2g26850-like isoform X2 [Arachis stenosperma]|uniref:F-box protein At2g26850-like isoform X2 n=1 Tax=Arachis stenosperma TaxID=217475 RepID=UPI0025AC3442|nr:F-box protein At2g26850-like isoform X2 [Arachis stenosperma]